MVITRGKWGRGQLEKDKRGIMMMKGDITLDGEHMLYYGIVHLNLIKFH